MTNHEPDTMPTPPDPGTLAATLRTTAASLSAAAHSLEGVAALLDGAPAPAGEAAPASAPNDATEVVPAGPTAPKKEPGRRRSPNQMAELMTKVLDVVTAHPGLLAKDIAPKVATGLGAEDIRDVLSKLKAAGRIRIEGQKQGTRYFSAGTPDVSAPTT